MASLAMLAAAQSLPAAGADPSETGQAATDDAAAGGNAQPVTFEAIVLGQIGNDASSKRPLAGAAIEIRRQGDSNAAPEQAQCDDQGQVQMTIEGGPGDYQATARMNGHRPQSVRIMAAHPASTTPPSSSSRGRRRCRSRNQKKVRSAAGLGPSAARSGHNSMPANLNSPFPQSESWKLIKRERNLLTRRFPLFASRIRQNGLRPVAPSPCPTTS